MFTNIVRGNVGKDSNNKLNQLADQCDKLQVR